MADQNLAKALFAAMLNASLIAVQGPRITSDTGAMKKIYDSIDALQVELDHWFAVSAGMEMSTADKAAVAPRPQITVATEADVPPAPAAVGNISARERAPLPPTRVRRRNAGGSGDPFNPTFFGEDDDIGPDPAAMALMERVSNEILGALPGE